MVRQLLQIVQQLDAILSYKHDRIIDDHFTFFVIFILCFSFWNMVDNSLPLPVKPTDPCGI